MVLDFKADTTIKSKNKFKIVLEDSLGNKKEYNSINELPVEDQKEFLKQNEKLSTTPELTKGHLDMKLRSIREIDDSSRLAYVDKYNSSPELKKQVAQLHKQNKVIEKQLEKNHVQTLQDEKISEKMQKYYQSTAGKLELEKYFKRKMDSITNDNRKLKNSRDFQPLPAPPIKF